MLNSEFTEITDHFPDQDDYMNPAQLAYFEKNCSGSARNC